MKKKFALLLVLSLVVGIFAGCGSKDAADAPANDAQEEVSSGDGVTIEFCYAGTDKRLECMQELCKAFTEETGINIELVTPNDDYEAVMKTRMSSGDMPDVWETHGYSTTRYKEYSEVLNDEEWVDRMMDTIKPLMVGTDGNIRALPVTQSMLAVVYNADVLEAADVDPAGIVHWDDFREACAKIKESGVTPMFFGGKDSHVFGYYYDIAGQSYYVPDGCMYPSASELQDGSFDWDTKGACVFEDMAWLANNGYVNEDLFSADEDGQVQALANGKCAFSFFDCNMYGYALGYNPDANLGIMPAPGTGTGAATYSPGEGTCLAIWKDSEVKEEAKQFLDFMARSENLAAFMEASAQIAGLEVGIDVDDPTYLALLESQEMYAGKAESFNVLDREYITVDIWQSMIDGAMEVFANPTEEGIASAVALCRDDYQAKHELAE